MLVACEMRWAIFKSASIYAFRIQSWLFEQFPLFFDFWDTHLFV
jgi:hypothetical protein